MFRPLIGLTGQRFTGKSIAGNLEVLHDSDIDVFYADYSRAIIAAGGVPLFLPLDVDPNSVADRLDGILMTGGSDIAPSCYGAEREADTQPADPRRDTHEIALLDIAADRGLPTLGICRGLQIINVHAGGTLLQHVPEHAGIDHPATTEWHKIAIEPDSVLESLYGQSKAVNSLHHQAVDQLGAALAATGVSDDGGIEAIEHTELPLLAVQWHPEMMPTSDKDPIFTWLVDAASARN